MAQEYNYTYINYIPLRLSGATRQQIEDRETINDFRNGACPDFLKDRILSRIISMTGQNAEDHIVCFMPATNADVTEHRYGCLAEFLNGKLNCKVYITPMAEDVRGKKIILIGDVITTGKAFGNVADNIVKAGGKSVYGIFVAKTACPTLTVLEDCGL